MALVRLTKPASGYFFAFCFDLNGAGTNSYRSSRGESAVVVVLDSISDVVGEWRLLCQADYGGLQAGDNPEVGVGGTTPR